MLGVDKSAHRLARHWDGELQNYILLRADVNDFLAAGGGGALAAGPTLSAVSNPYPKAAQVRKRWYARLHFRP